MDDFMLYCRELISREVGNYAEDTEWLRRLFTWLFIQAYPFALLMTPLFWPVWVILWSFNLIDDDEIEAYHRSRIGL